MPSFMKVVQYMGLLKRASYANFGYEDSSYLHNSNRYLQNLRSITAQMRDYREPFVDGIDISKGKSTVVVMSIEGEIIEMPFLC